MYNPILRGYLILVIYLLSLGNGERTKDKMYDQINGIAACFRRMNGTHQIGCSSQRLGSTGVIHYVSSRDDLHVILTTGTGGDYIPVMPITLLESLTPILQANNRIAGLILHKVNETISRMSHEAKCPNENSNMPGTCEKNWNQFGSGLLLEDYKFPIVYLSNDDDIAKIKECFGKYNNFSVENQGDRSLCSLELSSFMFAAVDTPTCLRRSNSVMNLNPVKFCDPMGDQNIWSSLFPLGNTTDVKIPVQIKYIVIAARLDTTSMFLEVNSGAVNPVSGLVTLLATAKLLKKMLPSYENYDKNVLFVLFNGESYDYIGSQRFLYDMANDEFPVPPFNDGNEAIAAIKPEDITLFIELNQLNVKFVNDDPELHVHVPEETEFTNDFLKKLSAHPHITVRTHPDSFPPSSLHTFHRNAPLNLSGVLLTDHDGERYTNRFYNDLYDDGAHMPYKYGGVEKVGSVQRGLARVCDVLAGSVYEEVTGVVYGGVETADVDLIDELLHCYLESSDCKVHQAIQKKKLKKEPLSFYVGVTVQPNLITSLVGLTLGWLTADAVDTNNGFCTANMTSYVYRYFNMSVNLEQLNETKCFRTCMNFTEAVSPAFLIEDYDWKSGQYSSWSESTWREFNLRMFLKPSAAHESMTLAIGSVTMVLSILLVYFVKSRSHVLFAPPVEISPTSC